MTETSQKIKILNPVILSTPKKTVNPNKQLKLRGYYVYIKLSELIFIELEDCLLIISTKGKGVRLQSLFCYKWWWHGILSFGETPDPSSYQRIYLPTCFLINGHFWFITQNQRPLRKSITLAYYYCLFETTFWGSSVWFAGYYSICYCRFLVLLRKNMIKTTLSFLMISVSMDLKIYNGGALNENLLKLQLLIFIFLMLTNKSYICHTNHH